MRAVALILALLLPAPAYGETSLSAVFAELEQQYAIPTGVLARIARAESNFQVQARNPGSSAFGLFQWLDTSWLHASRALYGQARPLSERGSPTVAAKVTAFTLAQAQTQLKPLIEAARVDMSTGLYMSHFLGTGGARKFFQAMAENPAGNAAALFPAAAASNRPIFYAGGQPRSFSEIVALMARKLGLESGVPAVPVSGDFTDSRGVPLSRSSADIRPEDFVPPSQIPQTETERDFQTDYAPASGVGAFLPGAGAASNLLGSPQAQSAPAPYVPPQIPGLIQPSMLFGSSSVPTFIATGSPAHSLLSALNPVATTTPMRVTLREDLRDASTVRGTTTVIVTPVMQEAGTMPAYTFLTQTVAATDDPRTFIARAIDSLRSILQRLSGRYVR